MCEASRRKQRLTGEWAPEKDDFTWLETAFCEEFLKHLTVVRGMEHEWRSGPSARQGGFWVLLWSKDPQRLWWELRDEFERQAAKQKTAEVRQRAARGTRRSKDGIWMGNAAEFKY